MSKAPSTFAALLAQQRFCETSVLRFDENTQRTGAKRRTAAFLNGRKKLLATYWCDYVATHKELLAIATPEDMTSPYFARGIQDVEDAFLDADARLDEWLGALSKSDAPTDQKSRATADAVSVALPQINLPTFAGDYKEWVSFEAQFRALIHDRPNINNVQRFRYLQSCLTGEASALITNLPTTADGYEAAWSALRTAFDRKRLVVSAHLTDLFAVRHMPNDTAASLKELLGGTTQSLRALAVLERPIEHWDDMIVHMTVAKLARPTRELWEAHLGADTDAPQFETLRNFLESRLITLEALSAGASNDAPSASQRRSTERRALLTNTHASCPRCKGKHALAQCSAFKNDHIEARVEFVRTQRLCFNCLEAHWVRECPQPRGCNKCEKRHHQLLHRWVPATKAEVNHVSTHTKNDDAALRQPPAESELRKCAQADRPGTAGGALAGNAPNGIAQMNSFVFLATAQIIVRNRIGRSVRMRAILDSGSQVTLISRRAVDCLQLRRRQTAMSLKGVGGSKLASTSSLVLLEIGAINDATFSATSEALVVPRVTSVANAPRGTTEERDMLQGVELADPEFRAGGPVDVLLGANICGQLLRDGIRTDSAGSITIQRTVFGWVVYGPSKACEEVTGGNALVAKAEDSPATSACALLHEQLQDFWRIEGILPEKRVTAEEALVEKHFAESHHRTDDGRYVVRLPTTEIKGERLGLGQTRGAAVRRLLQMETRLERDPALKEAYQKFMAEYQQLGHMEPVHDCDRGDRIFYLPHHAVTKADSTTTKLRVVFDASQQSSNGKSLNDVLLVGPTLQGNLAATLLRWRKHRFAFTADIEKMYRQVRTDAKDADLQRIVWRRNPTEPIKDYRLLTVTYGTASAAYAAVRAMRQLAADEAASFPIGSAIALRDFYVDDVLSGASNEEETLRATRELVELLKVGGFNLRKWASNSQRLMGSVPVADREVDLAFATDAKVKALGVCWDVVSDNIIFKCHLEPFRGPVTKRKVYSEIFKLYDPLGWLAPTIVMGKMFIQQLWASSIDWNEELSGSMLDSWKEYRASLTEVARISIPRWVGTSERETKQELHGFCDASEMAYAAAVYIRATTQDGAVTVRLLTAKTRIAPLKKISLPRLELSGALLLTQLMQGVIDDMQLPLTDVYAWTDSTIVLWWLQGNSSRWKTFVANRVTEIQEALPADKWRHVRSADNPADCASRGILGQELVKHPLWWQGPTWLAVGNFQQASDYRICDPPAVDLEERGQEPKTHLVSKESHELATRYSTLAKLLRITAHCQRFADNARTASGLRRTGSTTAAELKAARDTWCKVAQQQAFTTELRELRKGGSVPTKGTLSKLNPYVDASGLLRVGGRIHHAPLAHDERHPVILPGDHPVSRLLAQEAHATTLHGGPTLMLSMLRRQVWITNARNVARKVAHQCVTCFRHANQARTQLMGELPAPRVSPEPPFTHTGVDYAGPIRIRTATGRGYKSGKGYVAVFVCFSSKALHLEPVHDLSTAAFLAAFRRFTARRGACSNVYSDNGTNFTGAAAELKRAFRQAKDAAAATLVSEGTQWNFIPPAAPHFGGLWEAAVKSMKRHLKRVIGDHMLTFEELATVLAQIEACLNSRPLSPISADPDSLTPLTPGHFLIGRPLLAIPEPSLLSLPSNRLSRWQLVQQMTQGFWKRWSREYIHTLQQRSKWRTTKPMVNKDDVVLIREDNAPPTTWRLGRVLETHAGADGLVRVVSIHTQGGTLTRPIGKVAVLPIEG